MATKKPQQKSVLSQLQSVGEGAIGKIAQNPATRSALQGAMHLKDRGEQLVSGLGAVEKRLGEVEERLAAVERRLAAVEKQGEAAGAGGRVAARKPRSKASAGSARARPTPAKPKPDA